MQALIITSTPYKIEQPGIPESMIPNAKKFRCKIRIRSTSKFCIRFSSWFSLKKVKVIKHFFK